MDRCRFAAQKSGAESDYYGGLTPAYSNRNGVPLSLDELLLVRDVNRNMLYGNDLNYDFYTDAQENEILSEEDSSESISEDSIFPWTWLLTVHSAERNENTSGEPLINLNETDLQSLHQQLSEKLSDNWANYIVAYRQLGPAAETRDAALYSTGQPAGTMTIDFSKPAVFPINQLLELVGTTVKLIPVGGEAEVVYQSPLSATSENLAEELIGLFENCTVDPEKVIIGRINLNLAPAQILMAIPGMDETTVEAILNGRENQSSIDGETLNYPIWPLLEELVSLEKMEELLPYLTCGGDVYQAQIVGFYDQNGPFARAEVTIDGTQRSPRVVKWTDLRLQGQPFQLEFLGAQIDDLSSSSSNPAGEAGPAP
ncbi:MAG: hypothetical protein R3C11_23645 [Planctomycetaceae bacterium]